MLRITDLWFDRPMRVQHIANIRHDNCYTVEQPTPELTAEAGSDSSQSAGKKKVSFDKCKIECVHTFVHTITIIDTSHTCSAHIHWLLTLMRLGGGLSMCHQEKKVACDWNDIRVKKISQDRLVAMNLSI